MGKLDLLLLVRKNEKMILGMCEDLPSASYSGVLSTESKDTMRFVDSENNVDVDILKSRIKETTHNCFSSTNGANGSERLLSDDSNSKECDLSCSSEEGCNGSDEPDCKRSNSSSSVSDEKISLSNDSYQSYCESGLDPGVRLKSGLLISPITLTQDVPLDINEGSNNRLSTVLQNIQLPLVYIPTTRQLVTNKKGTENSQGASSSVDVPEEAAACNAGALSEHDSNQSTSTETILNIDDIDQNSEILKQTNLDTGSLGETDSLLRLKEPDQLTCSSLDLDSGIHRVHTGDSLLRTFNDASSLSSLSTCTDFSVSAASIDDGEGTGLCIDTGDGGFMEINLHSRNSFERCKNGSQDSGIDDRGAKPKRKGISGFLSRNIFSRKPKELDPESEQQGWKLFGRVTPKQVPVKDPEQISLEYKQRENQNNSVKTAKKQDIEVMSTTALILENRPMNLPTKDPEEAERHRQQYETMIEAAKKKEQRDLKMKRKQQMQQIKQEDQLLAAAKKWTNEILPNWETAKTSKKTRDLWWLGIPPMVRGKVWKLAIGNDLNLTQELYEICESRAEDRIRLTLTACDPGEVYGTSETSSEPPSSKESSVELIKLDVSRTFPQLCIFQKGGPYHDLLHSLLGAYACYRPDVGYVQGMSFIAAVLLLNMDVADAFLVFANLLNRPCQVAFFRIDEEMMKSYFQTYDDLFHENMPSLHRHFMKNSVTPDLYIIDWIFTLFSKSLPLDVACRVWDMFCRDGEEFLFRTALGILKMHENVLIQHDFIHCVQFLTKLPETLCADALFRSIESVRMNIDKKRFTQILAGNKETKDNT
ncbi:TBC1 domain family member 14-like [Ylistrum balloti]|uniref:TBC1 domain family member 14-like n=1 Tax=Ylistrum balloti TaxID=509963 RepID=UPI002905D5EA|nr:TBC1 domain family member 14-like [Ylistrum balloti]